MENIAPIEKECSKCYSVKLLIDFSKFKLGLYGRSSHCKACRKIYQHEWYLNKYYNDPIWREEKRQKGRDFKRRGYKDPIYKERKRIRDTLYRKNALKKDIKKRVAHNLRSRIYRAIKRGYKNQRSEILLGASFQEVKFYIESKFSPGMNWDNYGKYGWHVDHIKPCNSFDLTDLEQQKQCFHYTNLQPLWAEDNLKKGAKF